MGVAREGGGEMGSEVKAAAAVGRAEAVAGEEVDLLVACPDQVTFSLWRGGRETGGGGVGWGGAGEAGLGVIGVVAAEASLIGATAAPG